MGMVDREVVRQALTGPVPTVRTPFARDGAIDFSSLCRMIDFDAIMDPRGGFDAGIHGIMELCGLCKRWRRAPYVSLSDGEVEALGMRPRSRSIL